MSSIQENESIGMSKRSYVEAVLKGLKAVSSVDVDFMPDNENPEKIVNVLVPTTNHRHNVNNRKRIFVRLLLSIDRRETTEAAKETVSWHSWFIWANGEIFGSINRVHFFASGLSCSENEAFRGGWNRPIWKSINW